MILVLQLGQWRWSCSALNTKKWVPQVRGRHCELPADLSFWKCCSLPAGHGSCWVRGPRGSQELICKGFTGQKAASSLLRWLQTMPIKAVCIYCVFYILCTFLALFPFRNAALPGSSIISRSCIPSHWILGGAGTSDPCRPHLWHVTSCSGGSVTLGCGGDCDGEKWWLLGGSCGTHTPQASKGLIGKIFPKQLSARTEDPAITLDEIFEITLPCV